MRDRFHNHLDGYVPRWLLEAAGREADPLRPNIEPLRAAVVFADISGFSRLTRIYQDKGDAGVEALSLIISDYLGRVIERVFAWGGDIENLYGDALLAFWPDTGDGLTAAAERAVNCAVCIVGELDNYLSAGEMLRIRTAVVAGDLFAVRTGGGGGQWNFMLSGDCLGEMPPMLQVAKSGQICTSAAIRALFPGIPEIAAPEQLRALTVAAPAAAPPPGPAAMADNTFLTAFLPLSVRRRHLLTPEWLAEFRQVAMVCIGIPALRCDGPEDLSAIQGAMMTMQGHVEQFDGALIRMTMSDKGPMALIVFGLPDQAHDDDPVRAVRGAQEIQAAFASQGIIARATVTFGLAYCGIVGNAARHVYTTMGDVVNRAAKLLDQPGLPSLLCDGAIMGMAGQRIGFEPIEHRGYDGSVLFRPLGYRADAARFGRALIGRKTELAWLQSYLDRLDARAPVPVLYIDGEPGIGKTALIDAFTSVVEGRLALFRGGADPLAGTISPFAAWVPIFAAAFAAEIAGGPASCEARLREALERQRCPPQYAVLCGAVLAGAGLPSGDLLELPSEDRARVTGDTLTALLRDRLGGQPCAIVIEDVHWMDASSWRLVGQIAREVPGILTVLVARPDTAGPWPGMRELADTIPIERLQVGPLDLAATAALVADAVGCEDTAPVLAEIIHDRAIGNPLFARQLVLSLRDQGALILRDGLCRLADRSTETVARQLPVSIQRTMVARVDRLPVDLQMTLKTASVLGMTFSRRALGGVYRAQIREARPEQAIEQAGQGHVWDIAGNLAQLADIGMIGEVQGGEDGQLYSFDHALIQEAVYQLLPFELRRGLHMTAAVFFEAEPPARRPSPALLGLHWTRAGRPDRALPNWETAGVSALSGGAYREAVMALREALDAVALIAAAPEGAVSAGAIAVAPERTGQLHHHLGWALLQSGDFRLSEEHLTRALKYFGLTWPATRLGAGLTLMRHILIQAASVLLRSVGLKAGWAFAPPTDSRTDLVRKSALTLESLGQTLGLLSRFPDTITATLAAHNLSQRVGDTTIYSRSAGLLALMVLVGGSPRVARYYLAQARRTIPDESRPHDRLMTSEYIALYLLAAGQLKETEAELRGMLALASQHNNRRRQLDATSLLILTLIELGEFHICAPLIQKFEAAAERSGDVQLRCWSILEAAMLAVCLDDIETAQRRIMDANDLLTTQGSNERVWTVGLLASLELRRSRREAALAHARAVLVMMGEWRLLGFYAQPGVLGAAEVFLERLENPSARLTRAERAEAKRMLHLTWRFGMRQSLTRPATLVLLARYAMLRGRRAKAVRFIERALTLAEQQQQPAAAASARAALERVHVRQAQAP